MSSKSYYEEVLKGFGADSVHHLAENSRSSRKTPTHASLSKLPLIKKESNRGILIFLQDLSPKVLGTPYSLLAHLSGQLRHHPSLTGNPESLTGKRNTAEGHSKSSLLHPLLTGN